MVLLRLFSHKTLQSLVPIWKFPVIPNCCSYTGCHLKTSYTLTSFVRLEMYKNMQAAQMNDDGQRL